jgi:AraC-like DNA-binding protein
MEHGITIALAVFGGVAVCNSIFLSVLLLLQPGGLLKNTLLGWLFLSLAVRIGKSLLILVLPAVPSSIPAIGLVGMVLTGPLFYFYLRSVFEHKPLVRADAIHFILSVVTCVLLPIQSEAVIYALYIVAAGQLGVYLLWAWRYIQRHRQQEHYVWASGLWIGLIVLDLIYTSQIFVESDVAYLISTITASVVLYSILFLAFRKQHVFLPMRQSGMARDKANAIAQRVVVLFEKNYLYREANVTVTSVAEQIGIKPYLMSQALAIGLGKSFPELLTHYRIEEAKRRLTDPAFQHYSIEAIAFDCGFSTPSTFYVSFKKITSQTPSEFRVKNDKG